MRHEIFGDTYALKNNIEFSKDVLRGEIKLK